jgi:hypothetical protein
MLDMLHNMPNPPKTLEITGQIASVISFLQTVDSLQPGGVEDQRSNGIDTQIMDPAEVADPSTHGNWACTQHVSPDKDGQSVCQSDGVSEIDLMESRQTTADVPDGWMSRQTTNEHSVGWARSIDSLPPVAEFTRIAEENYETSTGRQFEEFQEAPPIAPSLRQTSSALGGMEDKSWSPTAPIRPYNIFQTSTAMGFQLTVKGTFLDFGSGTRAASSQARSVTP